VLERSWVLKKGAYCTASPDRRKKFEEGVKEGGELADVFAKKKE